MPKSQVSRMSETCSKYLIGRSRPNDGQDSTRTLECPGLTCSNNCFADVAFAIPVVAGAPCSKCRFTVISHFVVYSGKLSWLAQHTLPLGYPVPAFHQAGTYRNCWRYRGRHPMIRLGFASPSRCRNRSLLSLQCSNGIISSPLPLHLFW